MGTHRFAIASASLVALAGLLTGCSGSATAVPSTVVATDGPPLRSEAYAFESMNDLFVTLDGACVEGVCLVGAAPPESSLLVLFEPAAATCQHVTGYSASLDGRTLRIDALGNDDCPTTGTVLAFAALPSTLLAIPRSALPASGELDIVITPYGERYGGAPAQISTTIDLG